jgi:hypothetical protein
VVGAVFGKFGRVSLLLKGNRQIQGRQRQGYGSFSVIMFFDSFFVVFGHFWMDFGGGREDVFENLIVLENNLIQTNYSSILLISLLFSWPSCLDASRVLEFGYLEFLSRNLSGAIHSIFLMPTLFFIRSALSSYSLPML